MRATRTGAWTMAAMVVMAAALTPARAEANGGTATTLTPRRIVVSIPDRRLAVVENGHVLDVFVVAVGAPATPSPVGTFTIVTRVANPTYYRPGKIVPPGPANPIGTRWMGLNLKGYGIHGTDQPQSIGHAQSSGCIRLRNADAERLFEQVRAGDVVELHAERTPELTTLFEAR
jgi:lipoprotein-anchoring transpeptidase ErfK/SrfK